MEIRKKILLIIIILGFIGLYYSKTMLSIFPYAILLLGLSYKDSLNKIKSFFKSPAILSIFLIFFVFVLSGINSENTSKWFERLNINLIYLVIPLGIYLSGSYSKSYINKILALFVFINAIISIYLLSKYLIDFKYINEIYKIGQTIDTPIIHVRYSYFVALSILFSIYLYVQHFHFKYKNEKYLFVFIAVFLLIFIHIMAVRTGILSLYLTTIFMAIYYGYNKKMYKLGIIAVGLLIGVLVFSYFFLPSFKNKVEYVKWDIQTTMNGTAKYNTSDRIRINSIINGMEILKENPILGSGIGDIEFEMNKKYQLTYPELPKEMRFTPINQFIFTLSSMGFLGFILFYGLLLFPLFYLKSKHPLLIPFYVLTLSTFIGETTIALIVGKSAFLIILSILICSKE